MFNQNYTQIRVKMRFPPINKTDTSTDMTKKSFFLILLFDKIKTKNNLKYVLYPKLYLLYEKSFWLAHDSWAMKRKWPMIKKRPIAHKFVFENGS